jgi:hypothetical protein
MDHNEQPNSRRGVFKGLTTGLVLALPRQQPSASRDSRFRQIEESVSVVMRYKDEKLASFNCSFGGADRATYTITGTRGSVSFDPAYEDVGPRPCAWEIRSAPDILRSEINLLSSSIFQIAC